MRDPKGQALRAGPAPKQRDTRSSRAPCMLGARDRPGSSRASVRRVGGAAKRGTAPSSDGICGAQLEGDSQARRSSEGAREHQPSMRQGPASKGATAKNSRVPREGPGPGPGAASTRQAAAAPHRFFKINGGVRHGRATAATGLRKKINSKNLNCHEGGSVMPPEKLPFGQGSDSSPAQ
jgi:hypothetical protein